MFAKATTQFVKEIDPDGCLIPVLRVNNSDKLNILSLIFKRNGFWSWKRPKYLPSDFTLNDVLADMPIDPGVLESNFLKYEGTYADAMSGNMETKMGPASVAMKSRGSAKLQSSFGSLKKEEVDVQKLLLDSMGRRLNLNHCLIQQTREKRNEVFGILKERIITTQRCSIREKVKGHGSCGTGLGFCGPQSVKVSVMENGNMEMDRNVSMEIPPNTVIAYSIIELAIKQNGQYELCLQPDTFGGFEEKTSKGQSPELTDDQVEVDGPVRDDQEDDQPIPPESPLSVLEKYLENLKAHFQKLSDLPAQSRSKLFCYLREILPDRAAVSLLESVLEDWAWSKTLHLLDSEESQTQNETVRNLLEFLKASPGGLDQPDGSQLADSSLRTSVYLLISAIDEMTDTGLTWLEWSCDPTVLGALHHLVHCLLANRECSLQDSCLGLLAEEEVYLKVQQLFCSSKVTLQRETDRFWARTQPGSGHLPLVMCVAIQGLALLSKGQSAP